MGGTIPHGSEEAELENTNRRVEKSEAIICVPLVVLSHHGHRDHRLGSEIFPRGIDFFEKGQNLQHSILVHVRKE
jgi:hypothetical protein